MIEQNASLRERNAFLTDRTKRVSDIAKRFLVYDKAKCFRTLCVYPGLGFSVDCKHVVLGLITDNIWD